MSRFIDSIRLRYSLPAQLVLVNAAVFLSVSLLAIFRIDVSAWLSLPSDLHALAMRPWTVLTYMFTHFSFFHLLFNMLWLYWFGEFFLTLGTNRQLFMLYIYGGVTGAAFYLAAYNLPGFWFDYGLLCGASASVLAIVVATAWLMPHFKMQLFLFGSVSLKWLAVAAVVLSILALPGANAGGNIAHLGGAFIGSVYALMIKRGHDITRLFSRRKRRRPTVTVGHDDDRKTLDALLDKVRRSSYNSLNSSERKKLIELSNKL